MLKGLPRGSLFAWPVRCRHPPNTPLVLAEARTQVRTLPPGGGKGRVGGGGEDVPRGGGKRRAGSAPPPAGALETLEEARAEGIFSGHPAMPEYEYIPGEIAAIIAWMNSLEADLGAADRPIRGKMTQGQFSALTCQCRR